MANSITISAPKSVPSGATFPVSGSYTTTPGLTYNDDKGTAIALPGGATVSAASGTFQFTHPGLPVGTHTVNVAMGQTTASTSLTVTAPVSSMLTPTSGGSLQDGAGNTWTLTAAGVAIENGSPAAGGSGTSALTVINGTLYGQDAVSQSWYSWTGSGWNPATLPGPVPPTPTPTPTPTPVPTGVFSVRNGQFYDPSGALWIGKGINLYDDAIGRVTANGNGKPLLDLFPKLKVVRLNCYDYGIDTASHLQPFVAQMMGLKIVVIIEDHTGISATPYSGAALTKETSWYSGLATAFKDNPYVWFGTFNEPGGQNGGAAVTAQHVAIHDAIRATGSNAIVLFDPISGGNPGTVGAGFGLISASYSTMKNVGWDLHYYGWATKYSTDQKTVDAGLMGSVSSGSGIIACQTIRSAEGVMPVVIGEYGISTDGNTVDVNGTQVVTAVGNSGYSCMAWNWYSYGKSDNLTDNQNHLTPYGQQVAAIILNA